MFKAFVALPDDSTHSPASIEELQNLPLQEDKFLLWIDLEQPEQEELNQIGALFKLDAGALEDCLKGEQRPRIDEFDEYIFLVLYGMYGVGDETDIEPRKLAVFCGSQFLITVHREPLQTVRQLRKRCERRASKIMGQGLPFLLHSVIDGMVDKYGKVVDDYEGQLDNLEERSLQPDMDDSIMSEVGNLRTDLMELRRIAIAQKELLNPLAKGEFEHFSTALGIRFRHVRDHLTLVIEQIDDMRDRLRYVIDNYRATLADRMNSIVKVLTIFSAILLPLTFIASIYGMNFDKSFWPPSDHPFGFAGILFTMSVIAAFLFVVFRWRKWL